MRVLITKGNIFIAALAVCGLLAGCHKENNPVQPPPLKPLELLYPKGGESFKADSTVLIRWQINDSTKISSVMARLSTNNGMTYDVVITSSGPVFPPLTSVSWIAAAGQASTQCRIRIYDYQDGSINDQSGVFTVHN
ncbi:MAG: hypothetical protein JXA71_06870 [Chitinispirillaceae bacterium]|nr:hypothetical protein [Chitinispirillaceae bacterium]